MSELESFRDATILITGGTGSFGKQCAAALLECCSPRKVIIYSRDELKQHEMAVETPDPRLRFFLGDVRDRDRLVQAMRRGVDFVVHAAALKQIPAAEYNPIECIRTNVHGAENLIGAAADCGVKKVIALSTDKAVNPVNLYGATKLCADKLFTAANNMLGTDGMPRFGVVRYGNVVGSRGSVIPFFRALRSRGQAELPITDPAMTRFWISIEQGVRFVLRSLARLQGGELFVPKIPSMKVTDMVAELFPGCKTKITGVRPGEKLHEVLLSSHEARTAVEFDDHYVVCAGWWDEQRRRRHLAAGRPVASGFEYRSDNNDDWLDGVRLRALVGER